MRGASVFIEDIGGGGSEKYTPYSIAAVFENSPGDIFGKQFYPGQRLKGGRNLLFLRMGRLF